MSASRVCTMLNKLVFKHFDWCQNKAKYEHFEKYIDLRKVTSNRKLPICLSSLNI